VRRLTLLWLLAASPVVVAQTAADAGSAAWETLTECSKRAESEATGLDELDDECPGLRHALYELGYLDMLSQSTLDEFTLWHVKDLQQIAARYRDPISASAADPAALESELDSLQRQSAQQPQSAWQRFLAWLREIFKQQAQQEDTSPSWLSQWFNDFTLSEQLQDILFWSVVALVIGLAFSVVVNELRAAGVLRKRAGKVTAEEPGASPLAVTAIPRIEDLERVPRADRPSFLLRVLIATLQQTGRLASAKSLTHREVTSRATFDGTEQLESFQKIARVAEGALYGGLIPADAEVDAIVGEGRRLEVRLRRGAAP
jgi:hypothetical protein